MSVAETRGRVSRPRVMPDVMRKLASEILSGSRAPGSVLPSEAELTLTFGVSRTVIREALKVLAAKGLVTSRPRIGTTVCDPEDWNIIDPQVIEWHSAGQPDDRLMDAILETRRAIEPRAAELAATRASLQEIAGMEAACQVMAASGEDTARFVTADIELHRLLYAASHNPVFRQIGKLIDPALRSALAATGEHSPDHRANAIRVHSELVEALRLRNPQAARRAVESILDLATHDLAVIRAETASNPTSST